MISISVILPIYNVEKYLELTLHSINKQILIEFELIVVIDGSSDNSENILTSFNFREGIHLKIIKQKNQGLSKARNIGASLASSPFITFFDADDYYSSKHLSTMITSRSQVAFSSFESTNEENRLGTNYEDKDVHNPKFIIANKAINLFLKRKIRFHCSSMLISKNLFEKLNGFNSSFRYGEDFDFLIRLFINFSNIQIQYFDSKSYKYLIRQNSLMTSNNYEKYVIFYSNFMNTFNSLIGITSSRMLKKIHYRFISSIIRTTALNLDYQGYYKVILSIISKTKIDNYLLTFFLKISLNKIVFRLIKNL
jgi:glycosyltransferase involved in cell wall biosynthesis